MVKYPLWIQKLLYYTIQHDAAAILIFDKFCPGSLYDIGGSNPIPAFGL